MRIIVSMFLGAALMAGSLCIGAEPVVINDMELTVDMGDKIGKLVEDGKTTHSGEIQKQLVRKLAKVKLAVAGKEELKDLYASTVDGVGIIASVYNCGRCDKWHRSGCATCWVLSEDGVMVTNYHVFADSEHDGWGVLTKDGKVSAVKEVLAADKDMDIAIFRVEGEGFKPLPLGDSLRVGGGVNIIAHPDSRFFTYTAGSVSRYYQAQGKDATWMAVTAEFARGSSGGPAMDDAGNVVGMVANTQSIYYPKKKKTDIRGPFQMVIRNCVPVSSIKKLIEAE